MCYNPRKQHKSNKIEIYKQRDNITNRLSKQLS